MQVTVASGLAGIPHSAAFGGLYAAYNDANVTLSVDAAHSTQYRRDVVIAEILDTADGDASDAWQLRVVKGTNNATAPAPLPSTPAKSIWLSTINVDPSITNLSGKVSDSRIWLNTGGGTLLGTASFKPTTPATGTLVTDVDGRRQLSYWDGSAWRFIADNAWTAYTPTTSGFGTGTFTTRAGRYKYIAEKTIAIRIDIIMATNGTGTSNIAVGLPATPSRAGVEQNIVGRFDDGANTWYAGVGSVLSIGSGAQIDRVRFPLTGGSAADLDSYRGQDIDAGQAFHLTGILELA
jgi:hypothetical protein